MKYIFFIALLMGGLTAQAASVFKAEKDGNTVYIGGTVHLLSEKDYPLPSAYSTAYEASDELFFETDVSALANPQTQMHPAGRQLSHRCN